MKRLLLIVPLLFTACNIAPQDKAQNRLRQDVYWFADDAREGRLPGTPGAEATADYIASRFKTLGLLPAPVINAYQQSFELSGNVSVGSQNRLAKDDTLYTLDRDYRPLAFSPEGKVRGKLAFVGYGIRSEKYGYDDYAGCDVTGRIVMAMRFEPHTSDGKSLWAGDNYTDHSTIARKASEARARGAVALLLVNPPSHHPDEAPLRPFVSAGSRFDVAALPVISITPQLAQQFLGEKPEHDLMMLQKTIDEKTKPASFLIDTTMSADVDLEVQTTRTSNVMGVLPGANQDQFIVIGAHFDHIGRGLFSSRKPGEGLIHNGADDNASGVAAMLRVAEMLSKSPKLEKSVIFVAFSGEESGLHGSRYFVEHSPVQFSKVVAMINLDMVGRIRDQTLFVGGGGTRKAFRPILDKLDEQSSLVLKSIGEGGFGPSDHMSFAMKKVPVLFFFSGLHNQYHHPDDDAKLINFEGLSQTADLITKLIIAIADQPMESYVSRFDHHGMSISGSSTTQPATQGSRGARASLGVIPDYGTDQSTGGVRIGGSVPNSPAAAGGLIEGDVLIGWNDKKIGNLYDLSDRLNQSSPGDEVLITFTRSGTQMTTRVKLAARTTN